MAKSMVEDIILAEKKGENIIAEARKKAEEIQKVSELKSKGCAEEILTQAREKAKEIISAAERETIEKTENAERQAQADCESLGLCYEKNIERAVEAAISVLS